MGRLMFVVNVIFSYITEATLFKNSIRRSQHKRQACGQWCLLDINISKKGSSGGMK